MKLQCYSIYDIKAEIYHVPSYCHNDAHARRMYMSEIGKSQSVFHQFPEDFRIFKVGSFDDSTGMLTPEKTPVMLCELKSLVLENSDHED